MPAALSYPGVYIEEIPSGVHTITGVATSITAFLGRAISGPVNTPTIINSFGDFERQFGGLGFDYPMSYAVNDFFRNGGGQAIIVRLFKSKADVAAKLAADAKAKADEAERAAAASGTPPVPALLAAATAAKAAAATADADAKKAASDTAVGRFKIGELMLEAAAPGTWSNEISVKIDRNEINDDVAGRFGLAVPDLFNLTVSRTVNGRPVVLERLPNLTVKRDNEVPTAAGKARRIDRVLQQSSQFLRVPATAPFITIPTPAPTSPTLKQEEGEATAADKSAANTETLSNDDFIGHEDQKTGFHALDTADLFNLLCIPPDTRGGKTDKSVYQEAMKYCRDRRAMLIVDPPNDWDSNPVAAANNAKNGLGALGLNGDIARNAALYFPRVIQPDPLSQGQLDKFVPCGIVAGIMAATDAQRGVWKAPAGIAAGLTGIDGLSVNLTDKENGMLNPLGINCLRTFPITGTVVWGTRTLRGADQLADEYKYVPVRRLALFIEESLYRGTQWIVFEPNDEPLWAQIRLNIGAFMHNLFVQGAFQGQTPAVAYFVRCDKDTTTQNDIDLGIVNIIVGFAPLKPAEFVVIKIQQIAGNIQT